MDGPRLVISAAGDVDRDGDTDIKISHVIPLKDGAQVDMARAFIATLDAADDDEGLDGDVECRSTVTIPLKVFFIKTQKTIDTVGKIELKGV